MSVWRDPVGAVERIVDGFEADARVLDHLVELGCAPGSSRESRHYVYFPHESGAATVAGALGRAGWQTHIEECVDRSWLVVAARISALEPTTVRETRRILEALAAEHGGVYDGWETKAD